MNVVFFCQSCGSRFEVDAQHSGKSARCKKCGQKTVVPKAAELASMASLPAVKVPEASKAPASTARPFRKAGAMAGVAAAAVLDSVEAPPTRRSVIKEPRGPAPSMSTWIANVTSNVALAPVSADYATVPRRPVGKQGPMDNYEDDDSKPYQIVAQKGPRSPLGGPRKQVSGIKMLYRREVGGVAKLLKWVNETAYLISVPFIMVVLLGAIIHSRSIALLGATVVILLSLARIVVGIANMAVVPFKEGVTQGVMFLIPPFTFFYLANHWKTLRKPALRVIGPIVTVLGVLLAFTFLPSLRSDGAAAGSIADRIKAEAAELKGDIRGEIAKVKAGAPPVDLQQLSKDARQGLEKIKSGADTDSEAPK